MIATASGCLALLCIIGWPFFSNYRTVVKIQSVGAAAFTLYFLTLGSPTAAMACLISCSQLLISASVRDRYVVTRLYGASFILLVFLSVVTWHGIPSALALTGSSLGSLARLQTSTSRMKGLFLVGAPFWLAHNLMVGAVFALGTDLVSYQGALRLTHAGDSQADENLIRRCEHMEACDGGSDWGSI